MPRKAYKLEALRQLALGYLTIADECEAGGFKVTRSRLNLWDVAYLALAERDPRVSLSSENFSDAISYLVGLWLKAYPEALASKDYVDLAEWLVELRVERYGAA